MIKEVVVKFVVVEIVEVERVLDVRKGKVFEKHD